MPVNTGALARALRAKRGTRGLRSVSRDVGLSPSTLSRLENGSVPDLAAFEAVCRWLGCPLGTFLSERPVEAVTSRVSVLIEHPSREAVEDISDVLKAAYGRNAEVSAVTFSDGLYRRRIDVIGVWE